MATFKVFDRADEFRIEIIGRFVAEGVREVRNSWEKALRDNAPRRVSVDISRLSGYDAAGRKLLAEMVRHGTEFAARTPSSLVFLDEISSAPGIARLSFQRRFRTRANQAWDRAFERLQSGSSFHLAD